MHDGLPSIDHVGYILTLPPKVMNLDGTMVNVSVADTVPHGRKVNVTANADPFIGPATAGHPSLSAGARQRSFGPYSGRSVMALLQKSKKKDPVLIIMRLALKLAKSPKVQELLDGPESGEHDLDAIHRYLHVVRAHRLERSKQAMTVTKKCRHLGPKCWKFPRQRRRLKPLLTQQ